MSRQKIFKLLIAVLFVLSTAISCGAPQPTAAPPLPTSVPSAMPIQPTPTPTVSLDPALVSKIDAAVQDTLKQFSVPGIAIGLIKDGQVVYSKGFGLAELNTTRSVTPQTVFQIGSISRPIIAVAIMQLKEQGKIDLDAPVTKYLPYFQLADPRYKDITIRHLLTNQSGLSCASNGTDCDYTQDYQSPQTDAGALEKYIRGLTNIKLLGAPGQGGRYSDVGFEILGDVIAKVSSQTFEDYMQQHIFTPLGMKHTSFLLQDIPADLLSTPHILQGSKVVVNSFFPYSHQHAPIDLLSNVEDMSRFALATLNRGQLSGTRILATASYEEMWKAVDSSDIPDTKYGLGWFVAGLAGHRLVGFGGDDIGFHTAFVVAPEDGLGFIVFNNRQYDNWDLMLKLQQWLLGLND